MAITGHGHGRRRDVRRSPMRSACATTRGARASGRTSGGTAGSPSTSGPKLGFALTISGAEEDPDARRVGGFLYDVDRYGDDQLGADPRLQADVRLRRRVVPDEEPRHGHDRRPRLRGRRRRVVEHPVAQPSRGHGHPHHRGHDTLVVRRPDRRRPLGVPRPGRRWTSPSEPASVSERLQAVLEPVLGPVEIEDLRRLSGGASRETWSFTANGRALILRRDPPGRPGLPGSMRFEADAMRACRRAGLAAPEVLVDDDGTRARHRRPGDGPRRRARRSRAGSSATTSTPTRARAPRRRPRPIPRRPARHRSRRGAGRASTPTPSRSRGPPTSNSTTSARRSRRATNGCSPTGPPRTATTIVHGDLRLGNVIVDEHGLAAAIDWELVHVGDPLEDLAWLCVKAWRFGAPLEVGGRRHDRPARRRVRRRGRSPGRPRRAALVARREDPVVGHRLHGPGVRRTSRARSVPTSWPRSAGGSPNRSGT